MMLKIGDVLWCHDHRSNSRKWWTEKICGETTKSWIMEGLNRPSKVLKATMEENMGDYGHRRWYTPERRDEYLWKNTHARRIAALVENADVPILKQIAILVGYSENDGAGK